MHKYEIASYMFQVEAGASAAVRKALVFCSDNVNLRGWLTFYNDSTPIPEPSIDSNLRITLAFPMSHFGAIMELLRTEKPLYIYYHSPTFAGISSSSEPVGEEES